MKPKSLGIQVRFESTAETAVCRLSSLEWMPGCQWRNQWPVLMLKNSAPQSTKRMQDSPGHTRIHDAGELGYSTMGVILFDIEIQPKRGDLIQTNCGTKR